MAKNEKKKEQEGGGILGGILMLACGIYFIATQADTTWILFHIFEVSGLAIGIVGTIIGVFGLALGIADKKKEKENKTEE